MAPRPFDVVSFLSDYGHADTFVGVCHGVVLGRAPHARIVDLTHEVPRHDVRAGALLLARSVPYLPVAIHLAVVDPGVGTARRGVAVAAARGDLLVGPDNGLLGPAALALGGVAGAWELTAREFWLEPLSATFHGRDVFAPVAGALASGLDPSELGPAATDLVEIAPPAARRLDGRIEAEVLRADRFGNLQLAATPDDLAAIGAGDLAAVELEAGATPRRVPIVRTFGDLPTGALGLHEDSDGHLALVVREGSAADELGIGPGALVGLLRPGRPQRGSA